VKIGKGGEKGAWKQSKAGKEVQRGKSAKKGEKEI
jgi:hypothetical protein